MLSGQFLSALEQRRPSALYAIRTYHIKTDEKIVRRIAELIEGNS